MYEAREEHERRLAEVIERLAVDAEQRGDPGAAVEYTRRLVALDPLSEEHARSLMRRLALAEDRAAALAVFEQHRERLRSELRMVPSAATRALADEIRDGGGPAAARRGRAGHGRRDARRFPGRWRWRRVPVRSSGARTSSPRSRRRGTRSRTASRACA